jgi:hypothetical protein
MLMTSFTFPPIPLRLPDIQCRIANRLVEIGATLCFMGMAGGTDQDLEIRVLHRFLGQQTATRDAKGEVSRFS